MGEVSQKEEDRYDRLEVREKPIYTKSKERDSSLKKRELPATARA